MQAINRKMKEQGTARSFSIPKQYGRPEYEWILKSQTPVIFIANLVPTKLATQITHTTLSGTSIFII